MKCQYCPKSFVSIPSYHDHHKLYHPLRPLLCCCGRKYTTFQSFSKHLKKCGNFNCDSFSPNIPDDCVNDSLSVGDSSVNTINVPNLDSINFEPSASSSSRNTFDLNFALHLEADSFVSKLYAKPKLPRGYVQSFAEDVSDFVQNGVVVNLKRALLENLKLDSEQKAMLDNVFLSVQNPFSHLFSEYHRFKYFSASGDYIPPVPYEIGEVDNNDGPNLVKEKVFGQSVPLDQVLKKFLEVPNALNDIVNYVNSLDASSDIKENFIQCELWQTKPAKYSEHDIVLPLYTYFDECQCNNPLVSHADKLGCVYVQIACLPPECQSTVENIFLALVFKSCYRAFGDKKVCAPLIEKLKSLETDGIIIKTQDGPRRVYFVTSLLLGDNLGLNSLGGFVEGFSACYFCRFCKTHKSVTTSQCVEDLNSLRTVESYAQDIATNNYSVTGVKSECVFNDVSSFHIMSNFSVDIFHDLCEGVCHYVMMHVLRHCIPLYFSLELLNHRISMFNYGLCDSNRVPELSDEFAKKDKLKMSGSETLLFVRLFGILIGDKVPHDDEFWLLYVKLCEVLDVCSSKSLSVSQGASLRILTEELNCMYVSITKDTLKPKMHFLVHYASVFEKSGPLARFSTKRFESKHRTLLIPARATESRRDICRTVAIQHQLNILHRFKTAVSILPKLEFGPCSEVFLSDFSNIEFVKSLPASINLSDTT